MKDKFQRLLDEGIILGLPEDVQGIVDATMSEERITEIQNQIDEIIKQYYERKVN